MSLKNSKPSRLIRSKTSMSASSILHQKIPNIILFDNQLESVIEEEQTHLMIIKIREELIESVLEKCYEKYVEKARVKFLVDCLHNAWIKMFNIGLRYYDKQIINNAAVVWYKDAAPETSPMDTWAAHSVPIIDISSQELQAKEDEEDFDHDVDVPVHSDVDFSMASQRKPMQSDLGLQKSRLGIQPVCREESPSVYSYSEELYNEITPEPSFFTMLSNAERYSLPPISITRCIHEKEATRGVHSMFSNRLPTLPDCDNFFISLPPIKSRARYKLDRKTEYKPSTEDNAMKK